MVLVLGPITLLGGPRLRPRSLRRLILWLWLTLFEIFNRPSRLRVRALRLSPVVLMLPGESTFLGFRVFELFSTFWVHESLVVQDIHLSADQNAKGI